MATTKQIEANRRNAKKSTGPKTQDGKRTVSKNAVKHGLLSADVLMPGEDASEFTEFYQSALEELAPDSTIRFWQARMIISTMWRLRRISRIEAGRHTWETYAVPRDRIVGFDEAAYRRGIAEAISERYAPEMQAADKDERAAIAENIKALTQRTIDNGIFGYAANTDTTDLVGYEAKLHKQLRQLMAEYRAEGMPA
jgi:hypothetical protein